MLVCVSVVSFCKTARKKSIQKEHCRYDFIREHRKMPLRANMLLNNEWVLCAIIYRCASRWQRNEILKLNFNKTSCLWNCPEAKNWSFVDCCMMLIIIIISRHHEISYSTHKRAVKHITKVFQINISQKKGKKKNLLARWTILYSSNYLVTITCMYVHTIQRNK